MTPNITKKSIKLSDNRIIDIEIGELARQADGSAVVKLGNTMILATVVSSKELKADAGFFPLSVDYQERFASTGRIPGGFLKREGRLNDREILISRLIDRTLRPLFPEDYMYETQVNVYLISSDKDVQSDVLASVAASTALVCSDIPFKEPIAEVRVALHEGEFKINPPSDSSISNDLDIIVGGSKDNILMVEGELKEVSEDKMLESIQEAHETIKLLCNAQRELGEELNIIKRGYESFLSKDIKESDIEKSLYSTFYDIAKRHISSKLERQVAFESARKEYIEKNYKDSEGPVLSTVKYYVSKVEKKAIRTMVLEEGVRLDGRKHNEVRNIWSKIDYLPSAHGSALFTRGETQSLTSITLGTKLDEKIVDEAGYQGSKKFMLHYNFPGFSTGDVKPNRGPSRREIGHGNLASRALSFVLPDLEEYPYTIRLVSDILESNGSSSMATVCAGSMALMDTGVPTKSAVSGIAMGLISDPITNKQVVLSDILGDEDHLGDMDFKITGTAKGITACQMDIKVDGLSFETLSLALQQAKEGRLQILETMNSIIEKSRSDYRDSVPRIKKFSIHKDSIGAVIGPGGKSHNKNYKEKLTPQ